MEGEEGGELTGGKEARAGRVKRVLALHPPGTYVYSQVDGGNKGGGTRDGGGSTERRSDEGGIDSNREYRTGSSWSNRTSSNGESDSDSAITDS